MRGGDISNAEAGRLYFVAEGLVLLPLKDDRVRMMPNTRKIGSKRAIGSYLRSNYMISTWTFKRMWDLVWRLDFRIAIVTFASTSDDYVEALTEWLDEHDFPGPVRAYNLDHFMDTVVPLPSCLRIFDAEPTRALQFGPKGCWVDPSMDFEPLY